MKNLAFGADHAGFTLKEALRTYAETLGYTVQDFGTYSADRADYPDFAHPVAQAVQEGRADLGVLVCGSGNGVCITANRHKGVRAVLAWLPEIAALGRQHNNGNVVCIPARYVSEDEGKAILSSFLTAEFEGGRHAVRVNKVEEES
jgi:ribose 5-phosphate isomerase B